MGSNTTFEVDSTYDPSETSSEYSTESLTSSIYEYRYENGRRYHAYRAGSYPLPNDKKEQDRLDIVHHINHLLSNCLFHAPVTAPKRILDVGTGTGIWALDVAESYPAAKVIGTDLSPIQPNWLPDNAEFQIEDAEADWCWGEERFDLVHLRCLNGSIKDWRRLLGQAFEATKPGGWVEVDEYPILMYSDDGTLGPDSAMRRWCELFQEGVEKFGKSVDVSALGEMIKEVGFVGGGEKVFKVPVGPWAKHRKHKELGAYYLMQAESGFDAYGMALFTRVLGMETGEAKKVVEEAEMECKGRRVHAYVKRFVYWAQKPEC